MNCGQVCTRKVQLSPPEASTRVAAAQMAQWNVGTLVVIDDKERPIGVLTDRDLVVRVLAPGLDPDGSSVDQVMSPVPATVDEHDPLGQALWLMRNAQVRRLPVVRRDGRLVGLLSLDDVLSVLADELGTVQDILDTASPRVEPDVDEAGWHRHP